MKIPFYNGIAMHLSFPGNRDLGFWQHGQLKTAIFIWGVRREAQDLVLAAQR